MADEMDSSPGAARPEAGPGVLLRQAREQKGLSLQEVADGLNLKPRVVEALEQERYEQLPPRTFVKGYYKSYAKLVGVKEYDVLAALDRQLPEQTPTPLTPAAHERDVSRSAGGWLKWLLLLAVLAIGALLYFTRFEQAPAPAPAPLQEPELPPQPAEEAVGEPEPAPAAPVETVSEAAVEEPAPQVEAVPTPALPSSQSQPAAVPAPRAAAPAPAETARLVLRVNGESWLEVRDAAGQRRFIGLARGPRTLEFTGPPPFSLVIGDVGQVNVSYNGESVPLAPFARGKVARLSVPPAR